MSQNGVATPGDKLYPQPKTQNLVTLFDEKMSTDMKFAILCLAWGRDLAWNCFFSMVKQQSVG